MWGIIVPAYLAASVAGHAVLCRLPVGGNAVLKFVGVGVAAGLGLAAHAFMQVGLVVETWAALIFYAFGCELYIFLFTMVSSSVSASLLLTLRGGALNQGEINERYDDAAMVDRRVEKLLTNGLLRPESAGYALTSRGRSVLAVFERLRGFFRHEVDLVTRAPVQTPAAGSDSGNVVQP